MLNGGGGLNPDGLALDLQFAADKTFSKPSSLAASETAITSRKGPSAVFSRASGATFVDSDGLIKWGNENLFTRSEDFTQAIWVKTNVTVTGDNAISPDGTSNADSMFETTANGQHLVTFSPTAFAGPASLSVYAKSIGDRHITIEFNSIGGNGVYARINLANGTVVLSGAYGTGYTFISASALSVGNGWYRCTLSATLPSSWTGWFRSDDGSTFSFVGDPTRGLQLWGAQLERHTSVRQYIPTTTSAVYAPRFDHDSAGVCRGLLIEESRTNICRYSGELVSGTGWTTVGTVSVVDGVGPDGNNAYELSEITGGTFHTFLNTGGTGSTQAASITSGVTYTGSIFFKKITGSVDWVQVTFASAGFGASQYVNIDISNGTIGNSSGGTARVEQYANGWYRVSWTATATTTTTTSGTILIAGIQNTNGTARVPSYSGVGTNKFLAAMAQFEAGSFATSYIPTVASSVVRSADVCSITGGNFTSFYNPVEGSLAASVIFNAPVANATSQAIVDINDTTLANRLRLSRINTTGFPSLNNTSNSTANVSIAGSVALQPLTTQKYSSGFKLDDYAFYVNNAQIGTDNLGAMPISVTTFTIGDASAAFSPRIHLNGTIASLRYYRKRLPNAKLQALTV